jgi:hypothetical protein
LDDSHTSFQPLFPKAGWRKNIKRGAEKESWKSLPQSSGRVNKMRGFPEGWMEELETMEMMRDMDVSTRDGFLGAEVLSNLDEKYIVVGGTGLLVSGRLEHGLGGGGGLVSSNGKIIWNNNWMTPEILWDWCRVQTLLKLRSGRVILKGTTATSDVWREILIFN